MATDEYFVAVVPSGKATPYFGGPFDAELAAHEAEVKNHNGEGDHAVVIGRRQ